MRRPPMSRLFHCITLFFFFFNDTATTEIYTLSLHDALPIYAKSEQLNMTGSIKDRMALHILKTAYAEGKIHPGGTIAEATSGNTGISFAATGSVLGHPVSIFMPDWMS